MTTVTSIITRARRQSSVTAQLEARTAALRALAGSNLPMPVARAIVNAYARAAVGITVVDEAMLAFLISEDATQVEIDEIDWALLHPQAGDALAAMRGVR